MMCSCCSVPDAYDEERNEQEEEDTKKTKA